MLSYPTWEDVDKATGLKRILNLIDLLLLLYTYLNLGREELDEVLEWTAKACIQGHLLTCYPGVFLPLLGPQFPYL